MKKKLILLVLMILLFPGIVKAGELDLFYQDINVKIACDYCEPDENREVTIQLYADGTPVEGKQAVLNSANEFTYKFEDLLKFDEEYKEIIYEVKILKNGEYASIPEEDVKYKKETITDKWVSVAYNDITPGKDYVLITDNWNQEENGFSKRVALRGDVTVKGAKPVVDYKLIDGKKSFYTLTEEPPENSLWHLDEVPSSDPNYETFSDYYMLTDEIGKKLVLTGYDYGNDVINFMFKYSGKDGFIEEENAQYTNKVKFLPIGIKFGRFNIASKNLFPEPNNGMRYLGLDGYNQVRAQVEQEHGAQFIAFEKVSSAEVENVLEVEINTQLCEKPYYNIATNIEGEGNIEVVDKAQENDKVRFIVTPAPGKELVSITVTTESGETITYNMDEIEQHDDGTVTINSFTMPSGDVRIFATFKDSETNPQTADSITKSINVLIVSILGLITTLFLIKKK